MHVLALTSTIDRSEAAILSGLQQRGAMVHIIGTPSAEQEVTFKNLGMMIHRHHFSSRFDLRGIRLIWEVCAEHRIDSVYALTARGLSAAVLALFTKRIPIAAYRGTVGHISWFDPTCWLTYLNPRVKRIVCVSKAVEEYLISVGVSKKRLITIYKGHDVAWYDYPTPSRNEFGIPAEAFVVGCTAAMRSVKGIDDLLNAIRSLLTRIPSLHLLLVGSVKDDEIERAIKDFPEPARLHLTGYRADAARLARLADVVVMASKNREGFPRAIVEAMAQGVPAVVTSVGGMPELVNFGEAGIMVEPMNPDSLGRGIEHIYNDTKLRIRLGQAARDRIKGVFNIEITINKIEAMLREITSDSCRGRFAETNPSQMDCQR